MKNSIWLVVTAAALVTAAPLLGDNSGILGSWECDLYVDVNGETYPITITLEEVDGHLKGTVSGDVNRFEMTSVKYENEILTFQIDVPEAGGLVDFEVQFAEDDVSGSAGNYNFEGKVQGKRKKSP